MHDGREGQMDAWVDEVAPWDMAAAQVFSKSGRGVLRVNGKRSIYEGNCVACTPA